MYKINVAMAEMSMHKIEIWKYKNGLDEEKMRSGEGGS